MNQNRNQNRRRGRGNNRGGQSGHQGNRIDSRARGNAPQMLEKYKKLAHDASLNGDRVLTEYYLQFADHYFRVVADSRAQKEEGRPQRRDHEREQSFDTDEEETEDREDGGRDGSPRGDQPRRRRERSDSEPAEAEEGQRGLEGEDIQEVTAEDNPFVRDTRRSPRSTPRGRGRSRSAEAPKEEEAAAESAFDPGVLPPSISRDEEEAPRPARTRTRRARPAEDSGDETLEAVS